jgi:hypothetical protein
MGSGRQSTGKSRDEGEWRVVDDLAHDHPITPEELDAVEAFLMPLVHALLADGATIQPGKTNFISAPIPIPTHKRRNELLPEEILGRRPHHACRP